MQSLRPMRLTGKDAGRVRHEVVQMGLVPGQSIKRGERHVPKLMSLTRWSDDCLLYGRVDQSMTWKILETEMSHMVPRATLRSHQERAP
jgi:hypothetical protein